MHFSKFQFFFCCPSCSSSFGVEETFYPLTSLWELLTWSIDSFMKRGGIRTDGWAAFLKENIRGVNFWKEKFQNGKCHINKKTVFFSLCKMLLINKNHPWNYKCDRIWRERWFITKWNFQKSLRNFKKMWHMSETYSFNLKDGKNGFWDTN